MEQAKKRKANMIIRRLEEKDIQQHNEVSSSCFIWQVGESDDSLPEGILLGAFLDDNKTLMSNLECITFPVYFKQLTLKCLGIGGVATKPEYRRGGLVRALFDEAFRMSARQAWDISLLSPFSTVYYRKFGYDTVLWNIKARAEISSLSCIDRCFDVELVSNNNVEELIKLYNKIAKSTDLLVVRNEKGDFYHKPFSKCEYTYMYKRNGEARGFISYKIDRAQSLLAVNEIYFYDKQALLGLLGFLRTYEGNLKYIEFTRLPATTPVLSVIGEPRAFTITAFPGNSGRILNMESVLNATVFPREYGRFSFLSLDTVPACSGIFNVEYENKKGLITRSEDGEYDFSVSACAAAKLFLSGEGFSENLLSYIDGFEKKRDVTDLLKAFPARSTDFNKGF